MHPAADPCAPAAPPDTALREDVKYLLARVIRYLRKPGPHPALAEQVMFFLNRNGMTFSPLRTSGENAASEGVASSGNAPALATAPDRARLRDLVDLVWGRAMEDTSVPSTSMADEIIDQWQWEASLPSPSSSTADAVPASAAAALEPGAIAGVLTSLLQSFEDETAQQGASLAAHPAMADALEAARNRKPSHFHLHLVYRQEQISQAVLSAAGIPPNARWLFQNYRFAKSHVRRVIEMREGSQCCVDKASTILSAWLRFELDGRRIEFDYSGAYTFHLPRQVLCTHDEIVSFCESLRLLHHGRPEQYLQSLQVLLSPVAVARSAGK